MKYYAVELWIKDKHYDTYDWFDATENPEAALEQAKEEAYWMSGQEWFEESVASMNESLSGCTDLEVKIIKEGKF